jgi:hypothetical protein
MMAAMTTPAVMTTVAARGGPEPQDSRKAGVNYAWR